MEKIIETTQILKDSYCPNCDGYTEDSEITREYEIETWFCYKCKNHYCNNCYDAIEQDVIEEDETILLCEDCYYANNEN